MLKACVMKFLRTRAAVRMSANSSAERRRLRAAALLGAVAAMLLSSCGRSDTQPVLTRADLAGEWSSSHDATMTFYSDHRLKVSGLNLSAYLGGRNCKDISGSGTWQFLNSQGDSGSSLGSYTSGNQIALNFASPISPACDASFTSWEVDPPVGLCLDLDPDSPCSGDIFTKR